MNVANEKASPKTADALVNYPYIRELVAALGNSPAAEEEIVLRLVQNVQTWPKEGWLNTEKVRHIIRKVQGRKRERRV